MSNVVSLAAVRSRRERTQARSEEPLVAKREVAEYFDVSQRTIERWMRRGMPFEKPFAGGSVRFRLGECEQWFTSGGA